MTPKHLSIQDDSNPGRFSQRARWLMSERRQKVQKRSQSMLNRAAQEVGIDG